MRRLLFAMVFLGSAGCGDTMPQLLNEAAQTKSEFVDKLMLVVDEESCDRYFIRAKKAFDERIKDVDERFKKLKDNLGFDSFERAVQKKTLSKDGPPKVGAVMKGLGDDWVAQARLMIEAKFAEAQFKVQESYTEARLAREVARLASLEAALGRANAPKIAQMNSTLSAGSKGMPQNEFVVLKGVAPEELFLSGKVLDIKLEKFMLPPAPKYVAAAGAPPAKPGPAKPNPANPNPIMPMMPKP